MDILNYLVKITKKNQYKKILEKFLQAFLSLIIIGMILELFFDFLPQDLGPFLNPAKNLFEFFLPGDLDFFALFITTIESILITIYIEFYKKRK